MILCFHPAFMSVLVPITRNPKAAVAVSLPSSSSLFSVPPYFLLALGGLRGPRRSPWQGLGVGLSHCRVFVTFP